RDWKGTMRGETLNGPSRPNFSSALLSGTRPGKRGDPTTPQSRKSGRGACQPASACSTAATPTTVWSSAWLSRPAARGGAVGGPGRFRNAGKPSTVARTVPNPRTAQASGGFDAMTVTLDSLRVRQPGGWRPALTASG